LQRSIWWWCESSCGSRCTPLINPSKWVLVCCWCSVTQTWIPNRSCTKWWWCCGCLVVPSWGRELKDIGSKGWVLLRNWYLGSGWIILFSSSEDMVLSHAPKFCTNIIPQLQNFNTMYGLNFPNRRTIVRQNATR
jgi:hypothetical protein